MNLRIKKSYWQQDIKTGEYLLAMGQGIILIVGIAQLFYRSIWIGIPMLAGLVPYMKLWIQGQIQKQQQVFLGQFKDSLQSIAAALNVGYSVENAIKETRKDLSILYAPESRIMHEFIYMTHQINLNITVETVLEEWAERANLSEISSFVTVFITAKRTGGDSIAIIRNASQNICDKIDVKREIKTLMTAKKLEFKVMILIPLFILFYMRISFPEFMAALYGNAVGMLLMTGCLFIYGLACLWGRRIVDIEV